MIYIDWELVAIIAFVLICVPIAWGMYCMFANDRAFYVLNDRDNEALNDLLAKYKLKLYRIGSTDTPCNFRWSFEPAMEGISGRRMRKLLVALMKYSDEGNEICAEEVVKLLLTECCEANHTHIREMKKKARRL